MLLLLVIASQFLSIRANKECGLAKVFPDESNTENKTDDKALYIFQGKDVPEGMFPWIGYLVYGSPDKYAQCTVSLIRPKWLVTAAHCVLKECAKNAWVVMGLVKREEQKKGNIYKVAFIFHPKITKYVGKLEIPTHDIAMIKLEKEVDIAGSNGNINIICLPKPDQDLTGRVYLSGWGLTAEDAINPADTLKYITADIIPKCFNDDSKFCVRCNKKGQTPYQGDSGGPAQMLIDGRYYLHGALSGGNITVSLYTTVKNYLDWIVHLPTNETVMLNNCTKAEKTETH